MYEIRTISSFDKQIKALSKKYKSIKDDLLNIAKQVSENPTCGTLLFDNVYKIRMQIKSKGKGKSAGARLIYYNLFAKLQNNVIVFIAIYDKSDRENISDSEIKKALQEV